MEGGGVKGELLEGAGAKEELLDCAVVDVRLIWVEITLDQLRVMRWKPSCVRWYYKKLTSISHQVNIKKLNYFIAFIA